jgi:signal transduction histidine kinase
MRHPPGWLLQRATHAADIGCLAALFCLDDQGVIPAGYLMLAGMTLASVSSSHARERLRRTKFAAWVAPTRTRRPGAPGLAAIALQASEIIGCRRVLIVFRAGLDSEWHLAFAAADQLVHQRRPRSTWQWLVDPSQGDATFSANLTRRRLRVSGVRTGGAHLIDESLRAEFSIATVLASPISGRFCHGWVFFLDLQCTRRDARSWAEMVAARLALDIDHTALAGQVAEAAVTQERTRIGNELHDGVLQDLAGIALQLHGAQRNAATDRPQVLENVQPLLALAQAKLRSVVEQSGSTPKTTTLLAECLERSCDELSRTWRCKVKIDCPRDLNATLWVSRRLSRLLAESIANSVRHGGATEIRCDLTARPDLLRLRIADNGRGLSSAHVADAAREGVEPGSASLRARVLDLGGELLLQSTADGVVVEILIPRHAF